jgi:hypothetical protein
MVLTEFMGENAVGPGRFAAIQRWNDEQHGTEFTAVSFVRFLTMHMTTAPASLRGRCVPRVRQGPIRSARSPDRASRVGRTEECSRDSVSDRPRLIPAARQTELLREARHGDRKRHLEREVRIASLRGDGRDERSLAGGRRERGRRWAASLLRFVEAQYDMLAGIAVRTRTRALCNASRRRRSAM